MIQEHDLENVKKQPKQPIPAETAETNTTPENTVESTEAANFQALFSKFSVFFCQNQNICVILSRDRVYTHTAASRERHLTPRPNEASRWFRQQTRRGHAHSGIASLGLPH